MSFRIGVDVDGVMYKWGKTARYMLRDVMPNSPYKEDPRMKAAHTYWDFFRDLNKEANDWLWGEGVRLGLFRYGHLFPGTIVAIRQLAEMGEVHLITHRPRVAVNDTLAWVAYLDLPISGINILSDGEPKSSVMPHSDVYIDDKPSNVIDLASNTNAKAVIIPDRAWNQNYFGHSNGVCSKVHRTVGWDEAVAVVREVADGH